jgi:hypothetical protein
VSAAHDVGQAATPLHTYGEHDGLTPALPAGSTVQVPSALAPSACAHTSHPPPAQAASQQYPSVQWPVAHTRHPAARQSAPLASLHAVPWLWRGWHVPSAAQ